MSMQREMRDVTKRVRKVRDYWSERTTEYADDWGRASYDAGYHDAFVTLLFWLEQTPDEDLATKIDAEIRMYLDNADDWLTEAEEH